MADRSNQRSFRLTSDPNSVGLWAWVTAFWQEQAKRRKELVRDPLSFFGILFLYLVMGAIVSGSVCLFVMIQALGISDLLPSSEAIACIEILGHEADSAIPVKISDPQQVSEFVSVMERGIPTHLNHRGTTRRYSVVFRMVSGESEVEVLFTKQQGSLICANGYYFQCDRLRQTIVELTSGNHAFAGENR